MSFVGFLRLHQAEILSVVVLVAVLWYVIGYFAKRIEDDDSDLALVVLRIRRYITIFIIVLGALGLLSSAASNLTPRAVIDRSEVNRQQDKHEQEVQQKQRELEAARKKEKN